MDPVSTFQGLPPQEERSMMLDDDQDFSKTRAYLDPLIDAVLRRFAVPLRIGARQRLDRDIPVAAKRYLSHPDPDYSFAAYFTWYIHQALEGK